MIIRPLDLSVSPSVSACLALVTVVRAAVSPEPLSNQELEAACVQVLSLPLAVSGLVYADRLLFLHGKVSVLADVLSGYPSLHAQAVSLLGILMAAVFSAGVSPFSGGGGLSGGGGASGTWSAVSGERPPCVDSLPVIPVNRYKITGSVQFRTKSWIYGPDAVCPELRTDDRGVMCSLAWRFPYWYSVRCGQGESWDWLSDLPWFSGDECPACGRVHSATESVVDFPISGGVLVPSGAYEGCVLFPHFACVEVSGFVGVSEISGGWGAVLCWFGVLFPPFSISPVIDDPPVPVLPPLPGVLSSLALLSSLSASAWIDADGKTDVGGSPDSVGGSPCYMR